jgi:hypothetical protein
MYSSRGFCLLAAAACGWAGLGRCAGAACACAQGRCMCRLAGCLMTCALLLRCLPVLLPGVDPKSVVCEFFRHGRCEKGFKCKYSHDLSVERKTAKIDLFTDQRELGKEGEEVSAAQPPTAPQRSHQQGRSARRAATCWRGSSSRRSCVSCSTCCWTMLVHSMMQRAVVPTALQS